eukprot:3687464-Rhodomonas_salina.4
MVLAEASFAVSERVCHRRKIEKNSFDETLFAHLNQVVGFCAVPGYPGTRVLRVLACSGRIDYPLPRVPYRVHGYPVTAGSHT